MPILANTVSWLAPDLGPTEPKIRRELRALTNHSLPEQLAVQLSRQGIHATGPLAPLAAGDRDFFDRDAFADRLEAIHAKVTHAAMSPRMQMHYLTAALRPLADVIAVHATTTVRSQTGNGSLFSTATSIDSTTTPSSSRTGGRARRPSPTWPATEPGSDCCP